jgi:diamine N-acetyltransferase
VAVRLEEVSASNWRAVAEVAPRPEQERFVAPVTRYLCLCHYGGDWHPLAIVDGDEVVGHVMWAEDPADRAIWIGGLVIDARHQGRGVGRAAIAAMTDRFVSAPGGLALSYEPENVVARQLYASLGFVETGEREGDEIVARRR